MLCAPFSIIASTAYAEEDISNPVVSETNETIQIFVPLISGMDITFNDIYGATNGVSPIHSGLFMEKRYVDPFNNVHYKFSIAYRNIGDTAVTASWKILITLSGDNHAPVAYPPYTHEYGATKDLAPCCGADSMDQWSAEIIFNSGEYLAGAFYTCIAGDLDYTNMRAEANEGNNVEWSNQYWQTIIYGGALRFDAKIYNLEATSVSVSNYVLPSQVPSGWTVSISPSSLTIPSHSERVVHITIHRPASGINYTLVTHSYCSQYTWDVPNYIFTDPNGHFY